MSNKTKFILDNMSYFFKDLINEYEFDVIRIGKNNVALIGNHYGFEIYLHPYHGKNLFYIFKDNETNEYISIDPECYIRKLMYEDNKAKKLEKGMNVVINDEYKKFMIYLPQTISKFSKLYDMHDILQYILKIKSLHGDRWVSDYFYSYPTAHKIRLYFNEYKVFSKYF